ncbi:MAG: hypothetical protein ABIJ04_03790 [Bacteroidota bacterium]
MWKHSLYLPAFLAIVLTASGCGQFDNLWVRLNEEFYLSIGQRAFIAGENLEVRFKEVIEDSRCPTGVTCIWAGRVSCVIELAHTGSAYRMVLTESGLTDEYTRERYEGYELAFHVTPYPEAGKKIAKDTYRLHLIISKVPELTKIIGSIIAEPFAFEGQDITIVGYYSGWDLLHEANTPPPVTRSDWVIKDLTAAIYISAHSEAKVPEGLSPDSLQDTGIILKVKGIVCVTKEEQAYIEAKSIEYVP